jgi:hypothetical protein
LCYLFGLNWHVASEYKDINDKESLRRKLRQAAKDPMLGRIVGNAAELRSQMAVAQQRVQTLERQLDDFQVVPGLRWADVDLKAGTITVRQARVLAGYVVRIEEPKSRNGMRTLPLDDVLIALLRALRKLQRAERLAAGASYEASGYVAADEMGRPVHPEWYTDEFHRVTGRAGVRRIRLHESRHTACSLMEKARVPVSIISAWAGHYSGAFTMATYVHASAEDLAAGRGALAAIYRAGDMP